MQCRCISEVNADIKQMSATCMCAIRVFTKGSNHFGDERLCMDRRWWNSFYSILNDKMPHSPNRSSSALCWTQQDCDGAVCLTQRGRHVCIIERRGYRRSKRDRKKNEISGTFIYFGKSDHKCWVVRPVKTHSEAVKNTYGHISFEA